MKENKNDKLESKTIKTNFIKKIGYSVAKIEKYPDMASEGLGKAIGYLVRIVVIISIVLCLGMMFQTYDLIQEGVNYLKNEFPEFSYKDGVLNVESENEMIISLEKSVVGKTIIDTKTEEEQKINQHINEVTKEGEGIIILRDRVIIKNSSVVGTMSYSYKETFEPMGLVEFTKQDVFDYVNSSRIITLYISIFLTIFIYAFIMYLLTTFSNAIMLSFFGYITTLLVRIKMRYVAIFNMSVYALTLSVILNMLYIGINIFVPFNMEYFQVMYVAVAAIYLVAAILILKTELIKQQIELMKIVEAEDVVKKQISEKEQEDNEQEEKEDRRKKDRKQEKQEKKKNDKKEDLGSEPEGSKA